MKKKANLFVRLFDPRMWLFDFVKWTGALGVLLVLRTKRIYITGKKQKGLTRGDYIIVSNHISFLDPLIVGNAVPFRRVSYVATKEMFERRFGRFFKMCGIIEIDRDNPSVETFKKVKKHLQNGHIMCVFPEGHVYRDDETKAFKSGVIMMALMSDTDILPMYIGKRKTFKQRKVAVIGERIKLKDLFNTPFPTMVEIENAAKILREKEEILEHKFKELYSGGQL